MKEIKLDLLPLINKLEAVLRKGFTRELLAGGYQAVFKGKGMEFVGFRDYTPSDDALLIDWKASLRAHKPMVRVLQEERDLSVFFIMDVSDSMLFSSHKKLKCEYAAELLGTLCYAMQQVGDNVGLCMFSDKIVTVLPPGLGSSQFYRIVKSLSNPSLYGGKYDIGWMLLYILSLPFLKNDSILFIISDFIGLRPGWEEPLKIVGLKYDLNLVIVRDPVDMRMPDIGAEIRLSDPFSERRMTINPRDASQIFQTEASEQIARLKRELSKTNSSMLYLETDQDFTGEIFKFFRVRQSKRR
jgi:uncharacterized protein (DUF58 family)